MNDLIKEAESTISAGKLTLAAHNLQHLLKIQEEKVALDTIIGELRQTMSHSHAPEKLSHMLTAQAAILDAAFSYFLYKAQGSYVSEHMANMALKAQRQTVSTVNALRHLNKE